MSGTTFENKAVDVICQHTVDGKMIPLKIRMKDEDGEYQTYSIKEYRDFSEKGSFQIPEGLIVTSTIYPYELTILCFGSLRKIRVYYNCSSCVWYLSPGQKG